MTSLESLKYAFYILDECNMIRYDNIRFLQVINKQNDCAFTANDEQVFASYLQFCGIGLRNAQLYERSQLEVKRNQVLLDLARMIFEEQSTIEHMVLRILTHTQSLIQCQRVQVNRGVIYLFIFLLEVGLIFVFFVGPSRSRSLQRKFQ